MIRISVFRDSRLLVIRSDSAQKKNKGGAVKLFSERFTVRHTAVKTECLLFFLSGIQMFFIAILGQYIARDYMESKKRPIYIIKKKGGF